MRRLTPALIALVVVVAVTATIWFTTRPAPEQVTIAAAVEQVSSDGSAEVADGDWTVDTSVGEFSVEDTTGTFVGFRVDEELARIGAITAVSRTPAVTGASNWTAPP